MRIPRGGMPKECIGTEPEVGGMPIGGGGGPPKLPGGGAPKLPGGRGGPPAPPTEGGLIID